MTNIKAILACDSNCGIGKDGSLPWPRNSEDLKHFKEMTTGHIVVMGAGTWNDACFPKPLPNRENYIVTSQSGSYIGANVIDTNWQDAEFTIKELAEHNPDKTVWIIGGAELFNSMLHLISEIDLTVFHKYYNCDKYITSPFDSGFKLAESEYFSTGDETWTRCVFKRK